ncbi:DUF1998 domain-containing protein [Rubellimicrobium aerolatum]|uniref:DrmB family protein n=1 Tax=Rubellimicrobium aerolatum TaxID=490979 RepID=A0ABW0S8N3_9RHOB|nr:DUF1998 domain-containing protein [Rubellimicrobium aerolatum]MBP1804669.1 hypothetical protein [Rubellimicrobium aerolatum]
MTSDVTQGFSQFLYTYGPGAMMDLPEQGVIVAGVQDWRLGSEGVSRLIEEPRLSRLLMEQLDDVRLPEGTVPSLRTPPLHDPDRKDFNRPHVPVRIFPEWFVCDPAKGEAPTGGETRRLMTEFRNLTVKSDESLRGNVDGTEVRVSPIRFVAACPKGHLRDIDWRRMVHEAGDTCRRPLRWVERGVSSDPTDVTVRCDCGKSVSLANLHVPGRLGRCDGSSPWMNRWDRPEEGCDQDLHLLARSATNAYFPQVVSVISMPVESAAAAAALEDHWSTVEAIRAFPGFPAMLRALPQTAPAFAAFTDEEILEALATRGGGGSGQHPDPRIEEFDRLSARTATIGREGANSRLLGRRLDLDTLVIPSRIKGLLAGLVRVDRLREVACIYGFTRLEAAPSATESELDEIHLAVEGAPVGAGTAWFPAVEQLGEGIFLHLDPEAIAAWASQPEVLDHARRLRRGEELEARRRGVQHPEHLGVVYWALHSLSHALMIELSLECGYPLSSLKERIYASKPDGVPRYGLLIYTATSGGQGTLGGLSDMASQVPKLLAHALDGLTTCSNDPVCVEHRPDDQHDDRHLHGAACHACLLVPETSCEARNGRLDRALLIGSDTVVPLFEVGLGYDPGLP